MEELRGRISRIIYHNDDWVVASLDGGATIVGNMMRPSFGVTYTFNGEWVDHATYGRQFKIDSFTTEMPRNPMVIRTYLMENAKWIGPQVAMAIVEAFGESALEICKNEPERVSQAIRGLTLERAEQISEMLHGVEADETLSIQLKELFINIPVQKRALKNIAKRWKGDAPAIIRENPYILPDEVAGIGFITADLVGRRLGIKPNDPRRVHGGITHTMKEAANAQGHVCLPKREVVSRAQRLLSASRQSISPVLDEMIGKLLLRQREENVYLPELYEAERFVALKLRQMAKATAPPVTLDFTGLAPDQVDAIKKVFQGLVAVITGAPGTGKSFLTKRISTTLKGEVVRFCAPTGKAAKRVTEHTGGLEATTIHKLLDPKPRTINGQTVFAFSFDEDCPLPCDAVVVDEMSMVDIRLFASLLRAMQADTRLVLIGDTDQLPSVGPGNVLRDIIASGVIPCASLTTIKRQQPGLIIINSHRIKDGQDIEVRNADPKGDFFVFGKDDPPVIQREIVDLVKNRVPGKFGFDPIKDIQVISPFREKTILSVKTLNEALQDALNPGDPIGKSVFRIGDKVIQKKNDYQLDIINGDIGIIADLDGKKTLVVRFDSPERTVKIPLYGNDLHLAYAITCHSFQGSEAPCIVMPMHNSFGTVLMQRNWVYTAVTRAQKLCLVVGQRSVMRKAIRRNDYLKRYTTLKGLLVDGEKATVLTRGGS